MGAATATAYASVAAYCADGPFAIRGAVGWPGMGEHHRFNLGGTTLETATVVPMILGGDDSVPIPCLQAYEGLGPITVLRLDAHIDWRDEVQGERMGLSSNMRRASEMPWVENIIQVDARGVRDIGRRRKPRSPCVSATRRHDGPYCTPTLKADISATPCTRETSSPSRRVA